MSMKFGYLRRNFGQNLTLRNISMGPAVGKQGKCDFAECRCEASAACPSCCLAAGENRTECKVGARLGCFAAEKGGVPLLPLPHEGTDHSPLPTSMLRLHINNRFWLAQSCTTG